jgi:hypothetical protein
MKSNDQFEVSAELWPAVRSQWGVASPKTIK